MRRRILEGWLYHQGFQFHESLTPLILRDAAEGDEEAQLFIRQAEHWHATEMFQDKILRPLLALKNRDPELIFTTEPPLNPTAMP